MRGGFLVPALLLALFLDPRAALAQIAQPYWGGYGRNAQHTALADVATQSLSHIRWHTKVDLRPQYNGNELFIHYGSPLVTQANTVIVPVKVHATDGFRVEGRRGSDGRLLWRQFTNYRLPPHDWVPSFSPVLTAGGTLWVAGAGGTLYSRTRIDTRGSAPRRAIAFYGTTQYRAGRRAYEGAVFINTPLTADAAGDVFFGFQVTGATPLNLQSGIARVDATGQGTWVAATAAAGDPAFTKVAHNCAPALSADGNTLYLTVNNGPGTGSGPGYLLALNSHTLSTIAKVRLLDPQTGSDATVHDDATSSPSIGPDGDVYFGVLETSIGQHHFRGWLLHFDALLNPKGVPGSFGWDDTASIVPATMVSSYTGSSTYLLMTKYNNYADGGGDGVNRIAVLDPNDQMVDPISGRMVMREVMTAVGPTPDLEFRPTFPNAVREWCINTAAIDPVTKSILANNEDGVLYRWDMTTGTLSQSIVLTPGLGEAYTPTLIGPDGTVYAINNATLFAVGN